jgi:hypothetical protein
MDRQMDKKKTKKKKVSQGELIKLTDLIGALRDQLIEHEQARAPEFEPLFKIKNATVEADVTAKTEIETEGGMSFYLAKIGAKASQSSGCSFKMAITLEPLEEHRLVAGANP